MMKYDVEGGEVELTRVPAAKNERKRTVIPAIRRQNCCFAVAVVLLFAAGAAFVLTGASQFVFVHQEGLDYESNQGEVGVNASNAKEAIQQIEEAHHTTWWTSQHQPPTNQGRYSRPPSLPNNHDRTYNPGQPAVAPTPTQAVGTAGASPVAPQTRPPKPEEVVADGKANVTPISSKPTNAPAVKTNVPDKSANPPPTATKPPPGEPPEGGTPANNKDATSPPVDQAGGQKPPPVNTPPIVKHPGMVTPGAQGEAAAAITTANTTESQDYSTWLAANVTKDSGVMYEIVEQIPHDPAAFTQGLTFANGKLYESTGLYKHSSLRELDPVTGSVMTNLPLPPEIFGEGLDILDGRLIQITWKSGTGYLWDASNLTKPAEEFHYHTTKRDEGWGITHDPSSNELIVSDGSHNLVFWDSETFEILRTVPVTRLSGSPATNLNELEFWRGKVLANVWYEDVILVIDPVTGVTEKEYDFTNLWPYSQRPAGSDVFNGISVSADPNILYVTGKKWDRIFKIKLLPE